ncbi:MAG: ArsB/NhaD family transporter [bacterium]|nr:ArsB/NhaD family transporter [bacterium]
MEPAASSLSPDMIIAALILAISYILIFSEVIHRTSVAIIASIVMIIVGMLSGFYSQEAAMAAIDVNTLLLLMGMMMVVAMLRPTGGFEYVAIRMARMARGDGRLLLVYLSLVVSLISMVLDNVTTIIIFAPLTVLITRMLHLNPMPYLVAEAMLSNIGGVATLVGDPPNIMIGSAGGISFNSFLLHMIGPVLISWLCTTAMLLFFFRDHLKIKVSGSVDLDESRAIKNYPALWKALASLALVIILFFIHHHLDLYPSFVSFIGLAMAMALLRPRPEDLFGEVNWSVLFFFAGLFVIVGGVKASGLLDLAGHQLAVMAKEPDMILLTAISLIWVSALLSAVFDNIPFTVTMIPVILGLEGQGVNITPLWWALALGVGVGGNGTHIGATANIIAVTELENCGLSGAKISPTQWMRFGLPTMFFSLIAASLFYAVFFNFFL